MTHVTYHNIIALRALAAFYWTQVRMPNVWPHASSSYGGARDGESRQRHPPILCSTGGRYD